MVKASSQIEKELGLLQQRTEDMAIALDPIYDGYLDALADASKQQLMSAVYHLCTQAYPDRFLKLSWKERSELQKALQTLSAQIRSQLDEQRIQAKTKSRRPQRNSGLDFLHRLLESRTSGAIIHASERGSEDLLEKLSALVQEEHQSEQPNKRSDQRLDRETESLDGEQKERIESPHSNESDSTEDWEDDVPIAEEYDEGESDTSESLFTRSAQSKDSADKHDFSAVSLEDLDFPDSGTDSDDSDDLDDDDLDFEMDVPPAEQRLTISDEESLLSALEGLARTSAIAKDKSDDDTEQPLAPIHLFKQQMLMEKGIRDVFKTLSEEVNELLQKADVMPSFPKALMAAATDPQGIGEPVNAVPNVVRVSVRVMHGQIKADPENEHGNSSALSDSSGSESNGSESNRLGANGSRRDGPRVNRSELGRDERRRVRSKRDRSPRSRSRRANSSRHEIPHDLVEIEALPELALISLQLSEVAFSDPTVSAWRTRLRKELSTLKRLGNRYTKTQRSLETAQAEDAWRSSWMAVDKD